MRIFPLDKNQEATDCISLHQLYWCLAENRQPIPSEEFEIIKGEIPRGPRGNDAQILARLVEAWRINNVIIKGNLGKVLLREPEWDFDERVIDGAGLSAKAVRTQRKLREKSTHILDSGFVSLSVDIEAEHLAANSIIWEENLIVLWTHDQTGERLDTITLRTSLDSLASHNLMKLACFGRVQVDGYRRLFQNGLIKPHATRPQHFDETKVRGFIDRAVSRQKPKWLGLDHMFE